MASGDSVKRLDDLVLATVPAARPRRGETDRTKVADRRALREDLVELANEIRQSRFEQKRLDEAQVVTQLKRKCEWRHRRFIPPSP
ncbi:hypothetical protein FA10DRAFT_122140 [Acaromyces ingoldii]|uniref:Uncharacterized protein n=1 Tax=Acaromyces ingoldii TaxID=215250 RepID=A0A316YNW1_9BASI|nr:hypothetical protein FA10DRAFT_122140 [Acaromyces ingoldii]PWN90716.1 hypothetical protein FA10DRAFT_122140 [Acaromyces ingoldii]